MKRRINSLMVALTAMAGGAMAQSLSVDPIEVQTGEQTELVVSLTGGTAMTALQFNLTLPEGVSYAQTGDNYGATPGAATDGHTLSVLPLDGGDLLVILYSMNQNSFKDGELLRIPVPAGDKAVDVVVKNTNGCHIYFIDAELDVKGDVNGDGNVDVGDIMAVINFMAGQAAGIEKSVADVNGDTHVDVGDIMAIINIMAGQ